MRYTLCLMALLFLASPALAQNPTREQKVRADKVKVEAEGFWIYNDLPRAFAEGKARGRPIVVALRCIPCEHCVKLDDDLVDTDPRLRPLLEQFVRVRVISANGLDLSLFQFDTDQSFAVFLLNADGTIYGRYGTRSAREHWTDDVSLEGMSKALSGALEMHRNYPANREPLAGKRGPKPDFVVPEKYPKLSERYTSQLNYEGNVVQSCIHCHQVGDAQRQYHRDQSGVLPEQVLFPYPHPKAIGLVLDPKERAAVLRVEPGSPAEQAGFRAGDLIQTLAGQPLLSIADVQWVLHHVAPEGGSVTASVERQGKVQEIELRLAAGWRRRDDLAWRASSWELRRMALGGMLLYPLTDEERATLNLPAGRMALKVEHVGQYAPHNIAKKAGVEKGDVLVGYGGRTDLLRDSDVLFYGLNEIKPGESVELKLVRDGQAKSATIRTSK